MAKEDELTEEQERVIRNHFKEKYGHFPDEHDVDAAPQEDDLTPEQKKTIENYFKQKHGKSPDDEITTDIGDTHRLSIREESEGDGFIQKGGAVEGALVGGFQFADEFAAGLPEEFVKAAFPEFYKENIQPAKDRHDIVNKFAGIGGFFSPALLPRLGVKAVKGGYALHDKLFKKAYKITSKGLRKAGKGAASLAGKAGAGKAVGAASKLASPTGKKILASGIASSAVSTPYLYDEWKNGNFLSSLALSGAFGGALTGISRAANKYRLNKITKNDKELREILKQNNIEPTEELIFHIKDFIKHLQERVPNWKTLNNEELGNFINEYSATVGKRIGAAQKVTEAVGSKIDEFNKKLLNIETTQSFEKRIDNFNDYLEQVAPDEARKFKLNWGDFIDENGDVLQKKLNSRISKIKNSLGLGKVKPINSIDEFNSYIDTLSKETGLSLQGYKMKAEDFVNKSGKFLSAKFKREQQILRQKLHEETSRNFNTVSRKLLSGGNKRLAQLIEEEGKEFAKFYRRNFQGKIPEETIQARIDVMQDFLKIRLEASKVEGILKQTPEQLKTGRYETTQLKNFKSFFSELGQKIKESKKETDVLTYDELRGLIKDVGDKIDELKPNELALKKAYTLKKKQLEKVKDNYEKLVDKFSKDEKYEELYNLFLETPEIKNNLGSRGIKDLKELRSWYWSSKQIEKTLKKTEQANTPGGIKASVNINRTGIPSPYFYGSTADLIGTGALGVVGYGLGGVPGGSAGVAAGVIFSKAIRSLLKTSDYKAPVIIENAIKRNEILNKKMSKENILRFLGGKPGPGRYVLDKATDDESKESQESDYKDLQRQVNEEY